MKHPYRPAPAQRSLPWSPPEWVVRLGSGTAVFAFDTAVGLMLFGLAAFAVWFVASGAGRFGHFLFVLSGLAQPHFRDPTSEPTLYWFIGMVTATVPIWAPRLGKWWATRAPGNSH